MKIKKLDVCGFKSFVDRTVLRFDHDVSCVVGPNGCGKSNIVDAIRWVMGEQSAKQLRGKAMEDVIFNGAEGRGPLSFAEVSLTFENSDGLGLQQFRDYPEITVTRRMDRSGNSEYIINKTQVRLMDVTDLFLGTGAGRRAYSIIEQGRVGMLVSARPEERRQLFEEAAGITKFKARKRGAENKMNHTRQNLLRVNDIISEIEKTLASLKRQARKAERYKAYRNEVRDLELWVASHRWLELAGAHGVLREGIEAASARVDGAKVALRVREAEAESGRLALHEMEAALEKAQTRSYQLDNAIKLLESQIAHNLEQLAALREREAAGSNELEALARQREEVVAEWEATINRLRRLEEVEEAEVLVAEREDQELERRRQGEEEAAQVLGAARDRVAEAETRIARADAVLASFDKRRGDDRARLQRLSSERQALSARVSELLQQAEELRARLDGLQGGRGQIADRRTQIEQDLQRLRSEIRESDLHVEGLQADLATRRSRLHSLEEIQRRFEGVGTGVRAVMTHFAGELTDEQRAGVVGLVADRFECPPEFTHALAAALGERLQAVVVDDLATGVEAIRYLREGKRGRATLIPRVPAVASPAVVAGEGDARERLPELDGVLGPLVDHLTCSPEDRELCRHLLADVVLVEDLEVARRLHKRGSAGCVLATRAGEVLRPDGSLSGGDGEDTGAHVIQVKREIRELREEVASLDGELQRAQARHGELRTGIAQRQAALEGARTDAHAKEIATVEADRDLRRVEEAQSEASKRLERVASEVAELVRLQGEASDEEAEARREREVAQRAAVAAQEAVVAAAQIHRLRRASVEEQNQVVMEVRVRAAQAKQQAEGDRAAQHRLERSLEELDERAGRLQQDAIQCAAQEGELVGRVAKDRETLTVRVQNAMEAADVLAEQRAQYDAARDAVAREEAALRSVRVAIDGETARANELALQEREVAMELEHLVTRGYERHRVLVPKVLTDYHAREIPGEAVHTRIDELQRVVERMGEINLMAIEEYEERSQRYEYLTTQRLDLERALAQLETAIRRMNRESRRLFRQTFEDVNARFQRMFPRMFGGGRAELRLTNPEDLLESGIDIVAMPPGKKLAAIELMSGGEKALTAIALIFSLFQHKPSPFCLLDEVDAPLDEVNIGNFCDIVQEMTSQTQFILITHSRRTIMMADVLYGITMETPGISALVSVKMKQEEGTPAPSHPEDSAAVA